MASRHTLRSIVLQTLFQWDSGNLDGDIHKAVRENASDFSTNKQDFVFMNKLIDGVLKRQKDIDTIIEKAAPEWPLERIAPVDRNILRMGLYELLFANKKEVPPKVAINEAIELGKEFGGDSSGKFINGVLGSVYTELGEPEKSQTSDKKGEKVDYKDIPVEERAGAVVYARKGEDIYLALVHDVFGRWTLPKGHVEKGETPEDAVMREIKEGLSLEIETQEKLGTNEYIASHPDKGKLRKYVTYFLAESSFENMELNTSGGLDDAKWFKLAEVVNLKTYDDILPIITKAVNILLNNDSNNKS